MDKIKLLVLFVFCCGVFFMVCSFLIHPFDRQDEEKAHRPVETDNPVSPLLKRPIRKEIVFGCSISRTGKFSIEGKRVVEGYDFWRRKINSKGGLKVGSNRFAVNIIYYDDKSSVRFLRENIKRLILVDQVDFLLGPFSSGFTLAASEMAEQYKKILVGTCGASEAIFSRNTRTTFASLTSASWYLRDFFAMVSQLKAPPETYAVLTMDKLFTRSVAKGASIWGAKYNFSEVYHGLIPEERENFIVYLEEMAASPLSIFPLTKQASSILGYAKLRISSSFSRPSGASMRGSFSLPAFRPVPFGPGIFSL
ncbi:MAG: ABC transporter substrate-binding protein [Desulfobacteraceae bacterium]